MRHVENRRDKVNRNGNRFPQLESSRPVNVCFLIDELRTGGTETQLLRLIGQLDRTRVRPHLCLLDGMNDSSRRLEPDDCPVMRLGVRKLLSPRCIFGTRQFNKALKSWRIDVLQVHFPDSTYFGVPIAKWAGVPCVVRTRRDLFYWVTATHRRWGRHLDHLYNRYFVDCMIVNSDAVREATIRQERPAPQRIEVIPNGLDVSQYRRRPPAARGPSRLRIGILSMLRPEKRLDLVIEAAGKVVKRFGEAMFLIAGEGPERARLESMIESAGLHGRVRLLGVVQNVPAFLAELDIGVLCSDTEGFSNALVEYMVAGLPVVATAVGGNLELVQDGETGLLTAPSDSCALADAILYLMERPAERNRLAERARRAVQQQFELGAVATRHEEFYRALLLKHVDSRRRRDVGRLLQR